MIKDFFKGLRCFWVGFFRPFSMNYLYMDDDVKHPLAFKIGEIFGFAIVIKIILSIFIYMVVAL